MTRRDRDLPLSSHKRISQDQAGVTCVLVTGVNPTGWLPNAVWDMIKKALDENSLMYESYYNIFVPLSWFGLAYHQ